MEIYTVKPNDNIDQIALTYKVPVDSLIYINQMVYPYALALGQALLIPTANSAKSRVPAETLGYAYPCLLYTSFHTGGLLRHHGFIGRKIELSALHALPVLF